MPDARIVGQLAVHFLAGREGLVTVVKVFLDEAGINKGAKVLTVAGYAARPSHWIEFTKAWNRVLRPSGIKCYHATDAQALRGEFEGWKPEDRDELVKRLLPIIPKHAVGISISIVMPDFEAALADRPDLKEMFASPYGACFQWLLQSILELNAGATNRVRLAAVHETNNMKREAQQAWEWLSEQPRYAVKLVSLSFADKTEFVPLQAADILAFEVGRRLANQTGPERRALTALNPKPGSVWIRFYDKKNMPFLISVLERMKELKSVLEKQSA
jgi:hypothetical protein